MAVAVSLLVLVSLLAVNAQAESNQGTTSPWPMNGGDAHRSAHTPINLADNPGEIKWELEFNYRGTNSPPVIGANDTIYLTNEGGLYSISNDGDTNWRFDVGTADSSGLLLPLLVIIAIGAVGAAIFMAFRGRSRS